MESVSPYFQSSRHISSLPSTMTVANKKSRKRTNDERGMIGVSGIEFVDSQLVNQEFVVIDSNKQQVNGHVEEDLSNVEVKKEIITQVSPPKKKRDRFNGTSEEEVLKMTLPDRIKPGLDILIIGINPGLTAAYVGHHYAGPGNHFWKCLYSSGLIPEPLTAFQDEQALDYGIGLCNMVDRTTRGSNNLSRKEIKEGGEVLKEKIKQYKPKIAVFNGKGIYEVFCGNKKFCFGKQPDTLPGSDTILYVMPSSSARCAQLPRAADKVPFYVGLKKLREHLCGRLPDLKESEVCFPDLELKCPPRNKTEIQLVDAGNGQAITGKQIDRVNGHVIDQSKLGNLSKKAAQYCSNPNPTTSNTLSGYSSGPNMSFQHPIHPAFSTSANIMSNTVALPCTASSTFTPSNAQVTSQHDSIKGSNNQSLRQSMPNRNQEPVWTRPNTPIATSSQTGQHGDTADSTAHIPCTSSAVLTSEWINKHFNNPAFPVYNMNDSWTTHEDRGIYGKSPWHVSNLPGQGYVKYEMPSDGYGSVPPSR